MSWVALRTFVTRLIDFVLAQPEFSHNVQTYDKSVYLRVQDAQRCRIHSTMLLPLYMTPQRDHPFAVFEVCQSEKNVMFPSLVDLLQRCLEVRPCLASCNRINAMASSRTCEPMS